MTADAPPRLLSLASTYPRWPDDREPAFVHALNRRLAADFDVTVIAPHVRGARRQERLDGVDIRRFRYAPDALEQLAYDGGMLSRLKRARWRWLLLPFFFLFQWMAIIVTVRRLRPDVIHAHWLVPQAMIAVAALPFCGSKRPKLLATSHGGDLYSFDGSIGRRLKAWTLRHCDHLTVVSQAMKTDLQERFRNLPVIDVIPMGTDSAGTFASADPSLREQGRLLFVGRLVEKKGTSVLLDALSELVREHPGVTLDILGDGPCRPELEAQAARLSLGDRLRFHGSQPHEVVAKFMQSASLFVMPAIKARDGDQEGFGLVITEAMGCATAVIASDLPPIRDIVKDGETGLSVTPGDPVALATAIRQLLDDPAARERLGQAGRAHVERNFSWERVSRAYAGVITSLATN